MNTREKIHNNALLLFSQKGYADASIRDICKLVGIRESSLYFHYSGKQAILQELTENFIASYSDALNSFAESIRRINYLTPDIFRGIIDRYLQSCFLDEDARKFLCILLHEQGQNEELHQVMEKWIFLEPTELFKEMFMVLIETGFLKRVSVSYLAESFYAPILTCFFKHLAGEKPQQERFLSEYHNYLAKFLKEFQS